MAANRYLQMRALILAAVRTAQANAEASTPDSDEPKTPADVLESIVLGKFDNELKEGKTLISSSEAGGSFSFSIVGGLSPADVVELAMEALTWLNQQPDPLNPEVFPSKRIKRLRVSFAKATV